VKNEPEYLEAFALWDQAPSKLTLPRLTVLKLFSTKICCFSV
jgi:hypothetical protein